MSKLYRGVGVGLLLLLWLTGCASPNQEPTPTLASVVRLPAQMSVDQVAGLLEYNTFTVIDVRESWEFNEGHISGALLIPLAELPSRLDEIPTGRAIVLVCRSGGRSMQAYSYLKDQGINDVHNMRGGMLEWVAAGYPTVQ